MEQERIQMNFELVETTEAPFWASRCRICHEHLTLNPHGYALNQIDGFCKKEGKNLRQEIKRNTEDMNTHLERAVHQASLSRAIREEVLDKQAELSLIRRVQNNDETLPVIDTDTRNVKLIVHASAMMNIAPYNHPHLQKVIHHVGGKVG
jgi:hypothetical protein